MYQTFGMRAFVEDKARRAKQALDLGGSHLVQIDFDDVVLTRETWSALGRIAWKILDKYIAGPKTQEAVDRVLDYFQEAAFWVEETGELVLCVSFGEEDNFIKIPEGRWEVSVEVYH